MSKKEKVLVILLVILLSLLIGLIVLKFINKINNSNDDNVSAIENVIISSGYEFVGETKSGSGSVYDAKHYYSKENMVTCVMNITNDYNKSKKLVQDIYDQADRFEYNPEFTSTDYYYLVNYYDTDSETFKISLAILDYEFDIYTLRYQDKVEALANLIIKTLNG